MDDDEESFIRFPPPIVASWTIHVLADTAAAPRVRRTLSVCLEMQFVVVANG
jgi:hypothetical protein